jgi:hypothetical protein
MILVCQSSDTRLVSLLSPHKINNIFKLEVSFDLPPLVAPLSWQVDGIVGQTNTLSDPPLHVDHRITAMPSIRVLGAT